MNIERRGRQFAILIPAIVIALPGCSAPKSEYVAPPPVEVTVAKPLLQAVTLYLKKTGETEAAEHADVRARVRGFVEEINFEPGQSVKQGDLLYRIEKDQYQAEKDSAEALVAAAKAAIAVAKAQVTTAETEVARSGRELKRQETLIEQNATSQSEFDRALAEKESAEAIVIASNAAVEAAVAQHQQAVASLAQAQLDLDYTSVTAPIAGQVTKTAVKQGNLIEDGAELASIVNADQVFANFTISDREALGLQSSRSQAKTQPAQEVEGDWRTLPVFIRRETDDDFLFRGHVDYIDRQGIDAGTGTLAIRGIFDNPDGLLVPGLFVHVRIPVARDAEAILIPEKAIGRSELGNFVLLVGDENKVEQRMITTGQILDGWAIIKKGLTADDTIILDGLQRARPGTNVKPIDTTLQSDDSPFLSIKLRTSEETSALDAEQSTPVDRPNTDNPVER